MADVISHFTKSSFHTFNAPVVSSYQCVPHAIVGQSAGSVVWVNVGFSHHVVAFHILAIVPGGEPAACGSYHTLSQVGVVGSTSDATKVIGALQPVE